ncbi:MAG TPA: TauD/TfdA family dioxygenase [Kofleriaceae bacterium]|nr:TauD/TfdA family dioxygenase [Kofleriaceae bacterium]
MSGGGSLRPHLLTGVDLERMSAPEIAEVKRLVYRHKVVVVRGQELGPGELVRAAARFGDVETYFQKNYHHPDHPEVFVSSNVPLDGRKVGVAGTGRYWHCDYQFFPRPFSFVFVYPVVLPGSPRFTQFVDMADALRRLPAGLRAHLSSAVAVHDPKLKYKIQPSDVDKAIDEILAEVEKLVPPLRRKAVIEHPVTGEPVLFMSPGFTRGLASLSTEENAALMAEIFGHVLQDEHICSVQWTAGDLLLWDNISLIHRSSAAGLDGGPTTNFRVTVYDDAPGAAPAFLGRPDEHPAAGALEAASSSARRPRARARRPRPARGARPRGPRPSGSGSA